MILNRSGFPGHLAAIGAMGLLSSALASASPFSEGSGYLMLQDRLDRPTDGYCLDVAGSGNQSRLDLPMNVHNCKVPGVYADERVTLRGDGTIRFEAYGENACVTVLGLQGRSLPGAAVMIRGCGEQSPFLDTADLQQFTFHDSGQIELTGSGLCLVSGAESDVTYHPDHRWRTLSAQNCETAEPALSQWTMVLEEDIPSTITNPFP